MGTLFCTVRTACCLKVFFVKAPADRAKGWHVNMAPPPTPPGKPSRTCTAIVISQCKLKRNHNAHLPLLLGPMLCCPEAWKATAVHCPAAIADPNRTALSPLRTANLTALVSRSHAPRVSTCLRPHRTPGQRNCGTTQSKALLPASNGCQDRAAIPLLSCSAQPSSRLAARGPALGSPQRSDEPLLVPRAALAGRCRSTAKQHRRQRRHVCPAQVVTEQPSGCGQGGCNLLVLSLNFCSGTRKQCTARLPACCLLALCRWHPSGLGRRGATKVWQAPWKAGGPRCLAHGRQA